MLKRECLAGRQKLLLCEDGQASPRKEFTIRALISEEGGSALCYEAVLGNSGIGVLKEFYPQTVCGLARNEEGQLVFAPGSEDARERFRRAEEAYLEPYRIMLRARQDGKEPDLATFIPAFQIYRGCDRQGTPVGTSYLWLPKPKVETFNTICEQIHSHPDVEPERMLSTVLKAIETLTDCICALHRAEMLHRDINPANFGFSRRGNRTLTQMLTMFDIHTVCSVYAEPEEAVFTDGFSEPETGFRRPNNQTDIFSIGATLFHAIIVTEETAAAGNRYRPEFYGRLRELVDESALICASEFNAHPRLKNALTEILQKCLADRAHRYRNCEALLADLRQALYYAPEDLRKTPELNRKKNSFLAMQYQLFEHPLYECCGEEDALHVLIVGFGNYGQKFLDACLQAGQMFDKRLLVTVVSDDETDKDIYLKTRPALPEFFSVDGEGDTGEDRYGTLVFETASLSNSNPEANKATLEDVIYRHYDEKRPHYIFIALGEDLLNRAAAQACLLTRKAMEFDSAICYVQETKHGALEPSAHVYPLYVNVAPENFRSFAQVERMAYNTHLIWERNSYLETKRIRADFRKPYNHDSSVSSVLSIKYKLHSAGIELRADNYAEAARQYRQKLAESGQEALRNQLIWAEHRRWVVEKLCQGWRGLDTFESLTGDATKLDKRKQHICLVKSRPDQVLAGNAWSRDQCKKWDNASADDLNALDPLDRVSVKLYRMYAGRAKTLQNLLSGNIITGIRAMIEDYKPALTAFQEWYTCLQDLMAGDREKTRLYKSLTFAFLETVKGLPAAQKREAVKEQVKAFEAMFYPVLGKLKHRIFKNSDADIVDRIPFILTYTDKACLVIPYAISTDNNEQFDNAASALMINPQRIVYLCHLESQNDADLLLRSLPYLTAFLKKKRLQSLLDLALIFPQEMGKRMDAHFEQQLKQAGEGRVQGIKRFCYTSLSMLRPELERYLEQRQRGKAFFAIEKRRKGFSSVLETAGLYERFPAYQFQSTVMRFDDLHGCDMLQYLHTEPFLTASDVMAFRRSHSSSCNNPEFFSDYPALWDRYRKNSRVWKALCECLADYAGQNDVLAYFRRNQRDKNTQAQNYVYILPAECTRGAQKIVQALKEKQILEDGSRCSARTSDSCKVNIVDRYGYKQAFDRLFSNPYTLLNPDNLSVYLSPFTHDVNVLFDNLTVQELTLSGDETGMKGLLDFFAQMNYITNYKKTANGKVSFNFGCRQIKQLLTNAGRMLEVHTYHKAKETGAFDDIVCGFEIHWEDTEVKSEFDCILTKGFRMLFVECKARSTIDQEFYHRIAQLQQRFGINAIPVLIADTEERDSYDTAVTNSIQRQRGEMIDVVTIWDRAQINEIGKTLLRLLV